MNILCFGDSNTYGYCPDGSGRFDADTRWTVDWIRSVFSWKAMPLWICSS